VRFEVWPKTSYLLAAAALTGFAASIKYNLATVGIFPLLALTHAAVRRPRGYRPWWWVAVPALIGVAFLLASPTLRSRSAQGGFG
jgi:hypothetical protein